MLAGVASTKLAGQLMAGLMALLAIVLLCVGCWFAGNHYARADEQLLQQDAKVALLARARADFDAELARGQADVQRMQASLAAQQEQTDSLARRLAHVPRILSSRDCPSAGAAQLSRAGLVQLNAALGYPGVPGGAAGVPGAAAGVDPADTVGAGAWWLQPSGVTADDAQRNAEINYGRCTQIRTRCLALIDFVKTRPGNGQTTSLEIAP